MEEKKILIVDDSDLCLASFSDYLCRYEVMTATNGAEALISVTKNAPDLIFSDLNMPVMDGFKLINAIRNNPNLKKIPVIVLSEMNKMGDVEKALSLGANDYLTKSSINKELLLSKVRKYL